MHDDWREGQRRGVLGSPHFFIDDQGFFYPTLNVTRIDGHLQVAVDLAAFNDFVAVVLGADI